MQLSPEAKRALSIAAQTATLSGCPHIAPAHLFLALLDLESESIARLLEINGISLEQARLYAQAATPAENSFVSPTEIGRILSHAAREAAKMNRLHAAPEHLFLALVFSQSGEWSAVMQSLDFDNELTRKIAARVGQRTGRPTGHPLESLGESGLAAVEIAHEAMKNSFCGRISTAHLLLGVLNEPGGSAISFAFMHGFEADELRQKARESLVNDGEMATHEKRFTPAAKRAITRAKNLAAEENHRWIEAHHLFLGMLPEPASLWEQIGLQKRLDDPAGRILVGAKTREEPHQIEQTKSDRIALQLVGGTMGLVFWGAIGMMFLSFALDQVTIPAWPADWVSREAIQLIAAPFFSLCGFIYGWRIFGARK